MAEALQELRQRADGCLYPAGDGLMGGMGAVELPLSGLYRCAQSRPLRGNGHNRVPRLVVTVMPCLPGADYFHAVASPSMRTNTIPPLTGSPMRRVVTNRLSSIPSASATPSRPDLNAARQLSSSRRRRSGGQKVISSRISPSGATTPLASVSRWQSDRYPFAALLLCAQ